MEDTSQYVTISKFSKNERYEVAITSYAKMEWWEKRNLPSGQYALKHVIKDVVLKT